MSACSFLILPLSIVFPNSASLLPQWPQSKAAMATTVASPFTSSSLRSSFLRNSLPPRLPLLPIPTADSRTIRSTPAIGSVMGIGRQERVKPGPGQESVWDYPRPPALEPVPDRIRIEFNSRTIVDSTRAYRVLETSHPPVYYIPQEDIKMEFVKKASGTSFCEWKGNATYWTVQVDGRSAEKVGWSYDSPTATFRPIKSFIAFYAGPMDACYVGEERALPQPGGFYGGWVTEKVVGPFKGGPGSWGW